MHWIGSLRPFSAFCQRERPFFESKFLIAPLPRCTTRPWALKRWCFVNTGSPPTTSHLTRLSSSVASANHSACGLCRGVFMAKFAHILANCVASPVRAPHRWKTLLSCSLCSFAFVSSPPFSFYSPNWERSKYEQPISAKCRRRESLRVSGESCQVWGFSLLIFSLGKEKGCKLTRRGARLCWLQETGALQEFWKPTSLSLFSRLWQLFSPLFFTLKIQAGPIQIRRLAVLILMSRELPASLPTEKYVISLKAQQESLLLF